MGITVYGLASSLAPNDIRYIGQTRGMLSSRLRQHLNSASKPKNSLQRWLRSTADSGAAVLISVLVEDAQIDLDEIRMISSHRDAGADLFNATVGGPGAKGFRHTEAECLRRSERGLGRRLSDDTKAKLSRKLKSVPQSAAFRKICTTPKYAEANAFFGKTHTTAARHANGMARAKLTDDEVREIRALRAGGWTQERLAEAFSMSQAQISQLVRCISYDWVR